jgi:hypothetical protein
MSFIENNEKILEQVRRRQTQRADEMALAYANTYFLRLDPDGFAVIVPLNEFAARWWGSEYWHRNEFSFWNAHHENPQIMVVLPGLQEQAEFFMESFGESVGFRSCTGEGPEKFNIYSAKSEDWRRFGKLILWGLESNGEFLQIMPKETRTLELCEKAVRRTGSAIRHVPRHLISESLWEIALSQDGTALRHLGAGAELEDRFLEIAIRQNALSLAYVPMPRRSLSLCKIAVQQNGKALEFVPEPLRSRELYEEAVSSNGHALEYVPVISRDRLMLENALRNDGTALEHIEASSRSEDLCKLALAQTGLALRWLPKAFRTPEIYQKAVEKTANALWVVHEEHRTPELCSLAVHLDGQALNYVPTELRTPALCKTAVLNDWRAWQFVPHAVRGKIVGEVPGPPPPKWPPSMLEEIAQAIAPDRPGSAPMAPARL